MIEVGTKVRQVNGELNIMFPTIYPPIGTIGIVVEGGEEGCFLVNWGEESGVDYNKSHGDFAWWTGLDQVEVIK